MNGNIEEYALHLKKDYGDGIIERLTIAKHAPSKITAPEYELMIAHYKREVGKMKEKKITGI